MLYYNWGIIVKPKVYLAAQYMWRERIKEFAERLEDAGYTITSTWLHERKPLAIDLTDLSDRFNKSHARQDLLDLYASDILILFTVDPTTPVKRGGRHVEFGLAYAYNKRVIVCGPKENIFHYLDGVSQRNTFEEIFQMLEEEFK